MQFQVIIRCGEDGLFIPVEVFPVNSWYHNTMVELYTTVHFDFDWVDLSIRLYSVSVLLISWAIIGYIATWSLYGIEFMSVW